MRGLATLPLAAAVLHAARRISFAAANATLPAVPVVFTDWSRQIPQGLQSGTEGCRPTGVLRNF